MKRISKFKKVTIILGIGLLMLTACAPDSLTRGGGASSAPIEQRSTDDGAASNTNEVNDQAAPRVQPAAQPTATSASRTTLDSPLPTPTTQPTPGPQGEIEFTGTVEAIASDTWVVGGRTVAVTAATEIGPGLTIGVLAKVHAVQQADGTLWAREIELAGDDDDGNMNSNDDNGNNNDNDDGNVNSNDDNGNNNDNDDGNVNSNDDNGNDDNGNVNSNDDNGNDDHGGNGNDDYGGNNNGG